MTEHEARAEWLTIVGDPDIWRSIGLVVADDGLIPLFGTALRIVSSDAASSDSAPGIVGWALSGIEATTSIAGLSTTVVDRLPPTFASHALGAQSIDHVVVMTGELEPTTAEIAETTGCELKRVREVGKIRQGFHRLGRGGLIVEVVDHEDDRRTTPEFWGLVLVVDDLDAACARLGVDRVSDPKEAVQPGRRIATIRSEVGLGTAVALMSP